LFRMKRLTGSPPSHLTTKSPHTTRIPVSLPCAPIFSLFPFLATPSGCRVSSWVWFYALLASKGFTIIAQTWVLDSPSNTGQSSWSRVFLDTLPRGRFPPNLAPPPFPLFVIPYFLSSRTLCISSAMPFSLKVLPLTVAAQFTCYLYMYRLVNRVVLHQLYGAGQFSHFSVSFRLGGSQVSSQGSHESRGSNAIFLPLLH